MVDCPKLPSVTIVIPHRDSSYIYDCLGYCLKLDYPDYDIIVVTSSPLKMEDSRIKIIESADISQAEKRDIALREAKGEICAFIDDDCFPRKDWLKNAIKYFSDPMIAGVGGPGLSPEGDSLLQKAGGAVYGSLLLKSYRYSQKRSRFLDDYPAFNLIVRTSVFLEVGGFGSEYRSGEDTRLCMKIVQRGKKIIYADDVVVFHHRRPLLVSHLRQVWTYGMHRGHFARKYPETSRRIEYFLPTLLVSGLLILAALSIRFGFLFPILGLALASHFALGLTLGLLSTHQIDIALLTCLAIPPTLWTYGIAFVKGLLRDPRRSYQQLKVKPSTS